MWRISRKTNCIIEWLYYYWYYCKGNASIIEWDEYSSLLIKCNYCTCICVRLFVCVYVCMCMCVFACVCVCVCMYHCTLYWIRVTCTHTVEYNESTYEYLLPEYKYCIIIGLLSYTHNCLYIYAHYLKITRSE